MPVHLMNQIIQRRTFLAGLLACATPATGRAAGGGEQATEIHISAGQSWRSNAFPSFGKFGIDPAHVGLLALHTSYVGGGVKGPGPLPNSSGIHLAGHLDGVTHYAPDDPITIGRCAVAAQTLFRRRALLSAPDQLEFCMAYPGSGWTTGKGGGLGPGSIPWRDGLTIMAAIPGLLESQNRGAARFRSVGWTQGGARGTDPQDTVRQWTEMTESYDSLHLPGTATKPLNFYIAIHAATSNQNSLARAESCQGIYDFCRSNANRRCWGTTPWYQWPFSGPNDYAYGNIHTGPYGTLRHGELEGYAKFVVEDEGAGAYYPLWRSLRRPISQISDHGLKVPFDRPSGKDFEHGQLGWQSDTLDGISRASQYGWRLKRNGKFIPVEPSIDGLDVYLTCSERLAAGDQLEVSYAIYGVGGSNPGLHSGVWGNLMMAGPPSVLVPGKRLNAWAWPFLEAVQI